MKPKHSESRSGRIVVSLLLSAALGGCASSAPVETPKQIGGARDDQRVAFRMSDVVLMRYRYANVPFKPYVEELRSPAGVNVLRDSPFDHKHHHGLMFAVAVDGVNFWEETPASGKQVHRPRSHRTETSSGRDVRGTYTEHLDWIGPDDDEPLLHEYRTIELLAANDIGATLLTWQSRFTLPDGKAAARITGADYFGLGMRFPQSMDVDGEFRNADGGSGVAGTNARQSAWCSYAAGVDGKPVTVAIFDGPKNLRHPATWFTMEKPFAYLSATLNLKKEPLELKYGEPLTLRYGVAVWDGTAAPAEIDKLYRRWADLAAPTTRP